MPEALELAGLALLGFCVAVYGTLVGLGGGFLLVPALLLAYPEDPPQLITSLSLGVVFINAASGSLAYMRQKRIDYLAGNVFAACTIPGAIAGALAVGFIPREAFDAVFAVLLLAVAGLLLSRPVPRVVGRTARRGEVFRMITDAKGDTYAYSYDLRQGGAISLLAGFLSSLLGVGGGIIHVPAMVRVLRFPAHIATATSQYVLTATAFSGELVHILNGELAGGYARLAVLALAASLGAQLGAKLSTRLPAAQLVRLLAIGMVVVALRLLAGLAS